MTRGVGGGIAVVRLVSCVVDRVRRLPLDARACPDRSHRSRFRHGSLVRRHVLITHGCLRCFCGDSNAGCLEEVVRTAGRGREPGQQPERPSVKGTVGGKLSELHGSVIGRVRTHVLTARRRRARGTYSASSSPNPSNTDMRSFSSETSPPLGRSVVKARLPVDSAAPSVSPPMLCSPRDMSSGVCGTTNRVASEALPGSEVSAKGQCRDDVVFGGNVGRRTGHVLGPTTYRYGRRNL